MEATKILNFLNSPVVSQSSRNKLSLCDIPQLLWRQMWKLFSISLGVAVFLRTIHKNISLQMNNKLYANMALMRTLVLKFVACK